MYSKHGNTTIQNVLLSAGLSTHKFRGLFSSGLQEFLGAYHVSYAAYASYYDLKKQ